ncbi:hypothetical protein B0H13DRAFT_1915978 [Mycena leptocephala]|nr:hypothetical protein B0H13DRAFT_1915978 [Mycena leptocephala]
MAARPFSAAGGEEEASLAAATWVALSENFAGFALPPHSPLFLLLHLPHTSSRLITPLSFTPLLCHYQIKGASLIPAVPKPLATLRPQSPPDSKDASPKDVSPPTVSAPFSLCSTPPPGRLTPGTPLFVFVFDFLSFDMEPTTPHGSHSHRAAADLFSPSAPLQESPGSMSSLSMPGSSPQPSPQLHGEADLVSQGYLFNLPLPGDAGYTFPDPNATSISAPAIATLTEEYDEFDDYDEMSYDEIGEEQVRGGPYALRANIVPSSRANRSALKAQERRRESQAVDAAAPANAQASTSHCADAAAKPCPPPLWGSPDLASSRATHGAAAHGRDVDEAVGNTVRGPPTRGADRRSWELNETSAFGDTDRAPPPRAAATRDVDKALGDTVHGPPTHGADRAAGSSARQARSATPNGPHHLAPPQPMRASSLQAPATSAGTPVDYVPILPEHFSGTLTEFVVQAGFAPAGRSHLPPFDAPDLEAKREMMDDVLANEHGGHEGGVDARTASMMGNAMRSIAPLQTFASASRNAHPRHASRMAGSSRPSTKRSMRPPPRQEFVEPVSAVRQLRRQESSKGAAASQSLLPVGNTCPALKADELSRAYKAFVEFAGGEEEAHKMLSLFFQLSGTADDTSKLAGAVSTLRLKRWRSRYAERFRLDDFFALTIIVGAHTLEDEKLGEVISIPGIADALYEALATNEDEIIGFQKTAAATARRSRPASSQLAAPSTSGPSEHDPSPGAFDASAAGTASTGAASTAAAAAAALLPANTPLLRRDVLSKTTTIFPCEIRDDTPDLQDLRRVMSMASMEDLDMDVFKGRNGFTWTVLGPQLLEKGLRIINYPDNVRLPSEAPPTKASGSWTRAERRWLRVGLAARSTPGQGMRFQRASHPEGERNFVIFSHDYTLAHPAGAPDSAVVKTFWNSSTSPVHSGKKKAEPKAKEGSSSQKRKVDKDDEPEPEEETSPPPAKRLRHRTPEPQVGGGGDPGSPRRVDVPLVKRPRKDFPRTPPRVGGTHPRIRFTGTSHPLSGSESDDQPIQPPVRPQPKRIVLLFDSDSDDRAPARPKSVPRKRVVPDDDSEAEYSENDAEAEAVDPSPRVTRARSKAHNSGTSKVAPSKAAPSKPKPVVKVFDGVEVTPPSLKRSKTTPAAPAPTAEGSPPPIKRSRNATGAPAAESSQLASGTSRKAPSTAASNRSHRTPAQRQRDPQQAQPANPVVAAAARRPTAVVGAAAPPRCRCRRPSRRSQRSDPSADGAGADDAIPPLFGGAPAPGA